MQKVQKLLTSSDYELELIEENSFSQGNKYFSIIKLFCISFTLSFYYIII